MEHLRRRIRRARRFGSLALISMLAVTGLFGFVLVEGLLHATFLGRGDVVGRAGIGVAALVLVNLWAMSLVRHQRKILKGAESEITEWEENLKAG